MSTNQRNGQASPPAPAFAYITEKIHKAVRQRGTPDVPESWIKRILPGFLLPALVLAVWEVATIFSLVPPQLLVPPESVLQCLVRLAVSGVLWENLTVSLSLVLLGFTWGVLGGIAVGALMATFRTVDRLVHPLIQAIRQIPLFGWLPFLILLFGIGREFKIVFIGLSTFYVMVVNAYDGVKSVSPEHLEVSRIFGVGYFRRFTEVIIPEAMPSIFTGLKTGLSLSWMTVVGAEMVAASLGVGYLMNYLRTMFEYDVVNTMVFVIGVIGFLMNLVVNRIEQHVLRWRTTYRSSE